MRQSISSLAACLALSLCSASAAITHYVDVNGANPAAPYSTWATAATNIQDALNHAAFGDTVLVTNGVYQFGGNSLSGSNRVYVPYGVNLRSVNGPTVTTIVGYKVPGTTNGPAAVRCVYLDESSSLAGFTLTNGATDISGHGGGVYVNNSSCVISNCIITGNVANSMGGAVYGGFYNPRVTDCIISGNTAFYGGGVAGGNGSLIPVVDCVFSNNNAGYGGALYFGAATNCLFIGNGNTNTTTGGAAYLSLLVNCTVVGNFAHLLGALDGCSLANSIAFYNHTGSYVDCYQCRLTNCCTSSLVNNGIPVNCFTNPPGLVDLAGGNYRLQIGSPCIDAGTNAAATSAPDLDGNPRIFGGTVDIGAYENQFSGTAHFVDLNSTNPVAPYTNWLTAATNIQDAVASAQAGEIILANDGVYTGGGTAMAGTETNRIVLTNAVTLMSLNGAATTIIVGGTQVRCAYIGSNSVLYGFTLTNGHASVIGNVTNEQSGGGAWCETGGVISNCWVLGNVCSSSTGDVGGGVYGGAIYNSTLARNTGTGGGAAYAMLFNCNIASNSLTGPYSGGGILYSIASNCVLIANGGSGAYHSTLYHCTLFTNWSQGNGGAAYQSALYNCNLYTNSCSFGAAGAYQSYLTNCVLIGNHGAVGGTMNSTNYNCVFSGNSGSSSGNGGGGVSGGVSYDCIITNNSTPNSGGGAASATLYNCLLAGNAAFVGGGAATCTLNNCTVVGNTATNLGGGVHNSTANNSIVYYNSAPDGAAGPSFNSYGSKFNFGCSFPAVGGIVTTNPPLFVNSNSDFHLLSNSPCINSGTNLYATNLIADLDGNPRIVGIAVDIGAYEFQSPVGLLPYSWLWQYGLATDGSAESADSDGDGMSNYAEWKCGTVPTNSTSVLALRSLTTTNGPGTTVTWESVYSIRYFLQRATDLTAAPAFTTIATNIFGTSGNTTYNDTTATNAIPYFYRVGVQ